jgi:hypothetical protein
LEVKDKLDYVDKVMASYKAMTQKLPRDISVTCALCGIVVNEVAGFIIENRSVSEIEALIKADICANLGLLQEPCNLMVDALPVILQGLENQWSVSVVCVDLSFCTAPFTPHQDPVPMPRYTIDLDLPPLQRWSQICAVPDIKQNANYLYNVFTTLVPGTELGDLGQLLCDSYFPTEYCQEIMGCAQQFGFPYGYLALFNLGYEVSDACTSIIAQSHDGTIYHARNMDFWAGMGFTDTLKAIAVQVDFQKGGKTVFSTASFSGFVGVLSGFKSGAFSVTVDTRFYPGGIGQLFYEIIAAIEERNASLVSFLLRDVMQNENDYESALTNLINGELISDVYYIIAGASAGQGSVISRNRTGADDVWSLSYPARWYEVETNYDHWEPAPWFDDRIDPANDAMNAMGISGISLQSLFQVLSVKPVFNLQTTYTILSCPKTGDFDAFTRYCTYPCVE